LSILNVWFRFEEEDRNHASLNSSTRRRQHGWCPLSPRERAGVRGKAPRRTRHWTTVIRNSVFPSSSILLPCGEGGPRRGIRDADVRLCKRTSCSPPVPIFFLRTVLSRLSILAYQPLQATQRSAWPTPKRELVQPPVHVRRIDARSTLSSADFNRGDVTGCNIVDHVQHNQLPLFALPDMPRRGRWINTSARNNCTYDRRIYFKLSHSSWLASDF
jgi:hypothetical protein